MIEVTGNLWSYNPEGASADARVITTNASLDSRGEAIMGRGCALEASKQFPSLRQRLGERLKKDGNYIYVFTNLDIDYALVTFPVKHYWFDNADPDLIFRSACELADLTDKRGWNFVVMPRPGCGAGNLDWNDVRSLIKKVLDDRFYVITFEE